MQLTLNGWPPLASHLAAILIGFSISNLSHTPAKNELKLKKNSVVITLDTDSAPPKKYKFKRGKEVFLIGQNGNSKPCSLSTAKFRVLSARPYPSLKSSLKTFKTLDLSSIFSSKVKIAGARYSRELSPCEKQPRISYGR